MSAPLEVVLTLERKWVLYAFPAGATPTDERGIALGPDELGQLVDMQTRGLADALDTATKALEADRAELELLRAMNAERLHEQVVISMGSK